MSAEQETAEDVAWLRQQMQIGYAMAGRYKRALEMILVHELGALGSDDPGELRTALERCRDAAQLALDETWGMAARPTPAPPAEGETA